MAIKISKTSDIGIDSVKTVVYGGAGVGKTRLCATAPKPLIISAESGLLSLADVDCDYIEIDNLRDLDEAYRYVLKSDHSYETVCLDSLSEICEVLLEKILPDHKDGRQAYAELSRSVLPMLRKFRDLKGMHTVFTSKLKVVQDEDTGKVTEELLIPGAVLPAQIPYMVDEFFCLRTDRKGNTVLQTSPDRTRFAKDRSGALPKEMLDPNMTTVIDLIMKKQKTQGNK